MMNAKKILFIDRDGTLIEEPADEQIDSFAKLKFVKGMFRNLAFIAKNLDFRLVMVSNQDGLGTPSFPENTFWPVHNFILQTLEEKALSSTNNSSTVISPQTTTLIANRVLAC